MLVDLTVSSLIGYLRYSPSETLSDSHSDTSSYSSLRHSSSGYAILDSLRDSPIATSVGLSRKRCRNFDSITDLEVSSEDDYVSYIPIKVGLGVDVEDSYEPYTEPDVDSDIQTDIDACIAFADDLRARRTNVRVVVKTAAEEEVESSMRGTLEVEVDPRVGPVIDDDVRESIREDVPDHVTADGAVKVTYETLGGLVQRFRDHTMKIPAHQIQVIESVQRDQGHRIVATSQQSATMSERIGTLERDNVRLRGILDVERQRVYHLRHSMSTTRTTTHSRMTQDAINELVTKRMEEALKAYDAVRNPETGMEDDQQDDHVEANNNNGNDNGNGNGNPNVNNGGVVPVAR
ncbi:hypothetical protein Tco_1007559, partial [Tanacetum coccineum]